MQGFEVIFVTNMHDIYGVRALYNRVIKGLQKTKIIRCLKGQ